MKTGEAGEFPKQPYRLCVMPALVAGIHGLIARQQENWMAGTSPAMTID